MAIDVGHLPGRDPHRPAERRRRGRPLPHRAAREQDAVPGPAPHHRGDHGRRGRATDPEWKARRRLLGNREDLTDEQFATMWNPLLDEGKIGQTLLAAWIAKESLRTLLAMARTGADRHHIGQARYKFLTRCADADIPEVRTLATTVDRWWNEIAAFIDTGHSNAKSEAINRVIKLVARRCRRGRTASRPASPTYTGAAKCTAGLNGIRVCGALVQHHAASGS
ncbi:transposase [Streptomyces sp. NPDC101152]|uniref:transposase n=1 Tax=Streptomyces sp. NPDC101152 TaxID=3366116 RepID=UPI0037F9391A